MNLQRWRQIEALFHNASELPEQLRPAFLENSCGGDGGLRVAVESLLSADESLSIDVASAIQQEAEEVEKKLRSRL
jgi:eukaryotic-like serine/threonine-protein kinase